MAGVHRTREVTLYAVLARLASLPGDADGIRAAETLKKKLTTHAPTVEVGALLNPVTRPQHVRDVCEAELLGKLGPLLQGVLGLRARTREPFKAEPRKNNDATNQAVLHVIERLHRIREAEALLELGAVVVLREVDDSRDSTNQTRGSRGHGRSKARRRVGPKVSKATRRRVCSCRDACSCRATLKKRAARRQPKSADPEGTPCQPNRASRTVSAEPWAISNGQWAMGNGQWTMGNGLAEIPQQTIAFSTDSEVRV